VKIILLLALLSSAMLSAALAGPTCPSQPATSQQEMNKAVARRVFEEIFNRSKFEVADEIYAKDFVNHGLHRNFSLQEDQAAARWEKQTAPDLKISPDLMVAEGDLVTVIWTARGTNTAHLGWLPATGVKVEERGITVWRIVDGKIHEEWTSFDLFPIVRQFVTQLKWQLMALLFALIIVAWMATRFFHHRRRAPVQRNRNATFRDE
jgi:steroid delta-isomerase-like uncharacterized protein